MTFLWRVVGPQLPEINMELHGEEHVIRYIAFWLVPDELDHLVPGVCVEMVEVIKAERCFPFRYLSCTIPAQKRSHFEGVVVRK
jgi:hypothetical protein